MGVVTYQTIGVVRSPFTALEGLPLQTVAAQLVQGSVEFEPAYASGLKDLVDFSHLILLVIGLCLSGGGGNGQISGWGLHRRGGLEIWGRLSHDAVVTIGPMFWRSAWIMRYTSSMVSREGTLFSGT
jgi:hypothetical protein